MIANDRKRFVFVHVPKTGGTSVDWAIRNISGTMSCSSANTRHETASEIIARIPTVHNFKFFAFVRNPWDRIASYHRYLLNRYEKDPTPVHRTLEGFLEQIAGEEAWLMKRRGHRSQSSFLDAPMFAVGRFELLSDHLRIIGQSLGFSVKLPHLNRTLSAGNDFRGFFNSRSAEMVDRIYNIDIQRFGYSFTPVSKHNIDIGL